MSSISFDNVYLLFLALPLVVLVAIPFAITVRKDNRNGHNIASLVMHIVMALLIAFAAAGTSFTAVMTETEVYVVADVSYSADRNLDTVDNYINDIRRNLPRNSKMGVICFGKDYKMTTPLGGRLTSVKDAGVDDTETNIFNAVAYAGGLFKGDVLKHIVLITDCKPTYANDEAELLSLAAALKAQGVKFDAIYLNDNIDNFENAREVQISSAEFTENVYINREESVTFAVNSNYSANAIITLYKDGEVFGTPTAVSLSTGVNSVSFKLDTTAEGRFNYRAEVAVEEDDCELNNSYSFSQNVAGSINVMLLTDDDSDLEQVKALYDESAKITNYNLAKTADIPVSIEDLSEFDEFVISDVDLTKFDEYGMLIDSIETAVSLFGKSLVTFGNLGIQTKTAGELQTLDDMLPVRYGETDNEKKLFTIVIDVSPSMQIWSRMILARRGANKIIDSLKDTDSVCVIAFSGEVAVVQSPVTLSSKSARDEVKSTINNLNFGYGTFTSLGLKKAMETITRLPYSEKQLMLITDGLPFDGDMSYDGFDFEGVNSDRSYCTAFVEQMRANYIYTSVLQVGGGNEGNQEWLRVLAKSSGGGSYHPAQTEHELIDSFDDILGESLQLDPIHMDVDVVKEKPHDSVLQKTDDDGEVISGGYLNDVFIWDFVLNRQKSSATTVLTVDYKAEGKRFATSVPLYAYWDYGNGKVKTYSGYLNGIRSYGDAHSEDNEGFFKNVFSSALPVSRNPHPYTLTTEVSGKTAVLRMTPSYISSDAVAELSITTPTGETVTDNFVFNASNYEYEYNIPQSGDYDVNVKYSYGGNVYEADTSFTVSYEPEYDMFAVFDVTLLYKLIDGSGTVIETPTQKLVIENDPDEVATYTMYFTVPFLIAAVVLFVVDIAVRKLKWSDILSLFGLGKNNQGGKK